MHNGEGYNMSDKINKLHYFELMDRTSVIMDSIEDVLITHPAMTAKMKKNCEEAQFELYRVYNESSMLFDKFEENK